MKLTPLLSSLAIAIAITGCAQQNSQTAAPQAPNPYSIATLSQGNAQQPSVTGNVNIRQRVALPADAVLTVTLSDASLADAPAKVLSQKVVRTEGKQAPFSFVLPYDPAQIQPNARILLSAAVAINDRLVFITDTAHSVINEGGSHIDLNLVPVPQTAVPVTGSATTGSGSMTGGGLTGGSTSGGLTTDAPLMN